MRKFLPSLLAALLLPFFLLSCKNEPSVYAGLEHRGDKDVSITEIHADSVYLDASMTSFSGKFLMSAAGDKIYFVDYNAVGVSEYSLAGEYLGTKVMRGRGPDEMIAPSQGCTTDNMGNLILLDSNSGITIFDRSLEHKLFFTQSPFFQLLDEDFGQEDWNVIYNNPDPEVPQMYEYNLIINRLAFDGERLYIPISTEHVSYNLFERTSNSADCWKKSYILMSFVPNRISETKQLLGHYPPIYSERNIPSFGRYDFAVYGRKLYVSFNADSKIYVLDINGNPLYSFGIADPDIKCDYPQTRTFMEYEDKEFDHRQKYGYYDKLFLSEDITFRTCKTDSGRYKLQIYKGVDMTGDILLGRNMEVIGCSSDGYIYAYTRADYEEEKFVLIKFRI